MSKHQHFPYRHTIVRFLQTLYMVFYIFFILYLIIHLWSSHIRYINLVTSGHSTLTLTYPIGFVLKAFHTYEWLIFKYIYYFIWSSFIPSQHTFELYNSGFSLANLNYSLCNIHVITFEIFIKGFNASVHLFMWFPSTLFYLSFF